MQLQPGLQYGAAGPSGMYPPAGQYIPMPQQQQNEQLRLFWLQQQQEIQQVQFPRRCFAYIIQGHVCAAADCPKCTRLRVQVGTDPAEFKNHQLPLARIKKVRISRLCSLCLFEQTTVLLCGLFCTPSLKISLRRS